jgi:hypothetical protein
VTHDVRATIGKRAFHTAHLLLEIGCRRLIRDRRLAINMPRIAMPPHHVQRCRVQFADDEEAPFQALSALAYVLRHQTIMWLPVSVRQIRDDRRAFRDDQIVIPRQRDLLPGIERGKLGRFRFAGAGLDRPALIRQVQMARP